MIKFEKTPVFKSEAKRLAKHYPSFVEDLKELAKSLKKNPDQGTPLAGGFRKIRMAITIVISVIPASCSCRIWRSIRISPFTFNKPFGFSYERGAKRDEVPAAIIIAFINN